LVELADQIRRLLLMWRDGNYREAITTLPNVLGLVKDSSGSGLDLQAGERVAEKMSEYGAWCRIAGRHFRIVDFLDNITAHASRNLGSRGRARVGDRVQIWSIPDSRGQEARFVFLSGTNDGSLPLPYRRRSLIPDKDKNVWRSALEEMGTPADLSDLDDFDKHWAKESERFQLASSRALERLYITYCRGESAEETLEPSPFLTAKPSTGSKSILGLSRADSPASPCHSRRASRSMCHSYLAFRVSICY